MKNKQIKPVFFFKLLRQATETVKISFNNWGKNYGANFKNPGSLWFCFCTTAPKIMSPLHLIWIKVFWNYVPIAGSLKNEARTGFFGSNVYETYPQPLERPHRVRNTNRTITTSFQCLDPSGLGLS